MNISYLQAALALLLAGTSVNASAAIDPHDLEVTGTIRTPLCVVTADNEGVYEYGKINLANIPATGHLKLPPLNQQWVVNCGRGVTYLGFQVVDNRAASASAAGNDKFGLGEVADAPGSRIGYYTVTLSGALLDGATAYVLKAAPGAGSGVAATSIGLDQTQSHSWASMAGTDQPPAAGSVFSVGLAVEGNIADATTRGAPVTEGTSLDGSMTLSYSFGL